MKKGMSHIEIHAPVVEMENAVELSSLVKVDSNVLREVTDGDDNPKFVVVDIEECRSGNNINYDRDAFTLIADQVNDKLPNGYLGHIKDQDRDTAFPMPQCLWLGATVTKGSDGKAHLIAKGYVPPEADARSLIKRRMINSVSWAGDAILTPAKGGGYKLTEYVLESIDFARKLKEGLKGQNLVLVTEEIKDHDSGGRRKVDGDEKTYEEIVGRLTFAEVKTLNPALVKVIQEMAKDEVKEETVTAVKAKEDELTTKHDAEIAAMPEKTILQQIMTLLKVDDLEKVEDRVVALLEQLDSLGKKAIQAWFNDEILAKKVPNEKARKLVGRLIPVTEMEGDWRTEKGQEAIKKSLEDRIDDVIENDDEIQTVIREMGSTRGGVRLKEMDRGSRDRQEFTGNKDDDDDVERRSGGRMKVERVKVG